jgi:hypothetical protein
MKAKQTKTQKIIDWFVKHPSSDVKVVAKKFDAAVPMVYKLRKRAMNTDVVNEAVKDVFPTRKITLNAGQVAIAKKFDIPLETFIKAGIANGTIQYDDEKLPVEDACQDCDEPEDTVDAILNNRAKQYGKFIEGAEIMQMTKRLVHNYVEQRGTSLAFDQLEAIDMIIHKLGRIINGNPDKVDHWDDIAGYATLVSDRLKGNTR